MPIYKPSPYKKYPFLHNSIVRTGLAGTPGVPPLEKIGKNALLPPYSVEIPGMSEEQLRGVLISHISIFLHNALFVRDFPTNNRLKALLKSAEKKLVRIKHNPWTNLMLEYGKIGECPLPEDIDNNYDAVEKVALSMARPEWEKTVPNLIVSFVDWLIENREAIENWIANRLRLFSASLYS
tara:strand:+ start:32271 stop:32813 length:543 start_codon:yes stop_codon:yes gene_type:complete